MRRIEFFNGEIYHIYNRGIDGRAIFNDDFDRLRFVHDLFEFNDIEAALNLGRRVSKSEYLALKAARQKRKILVEILAFCLMENHYHLLARQRRKEGIPKFLHKLGTGYTLYFNKKYQRKGPIFESAFKAIHVTKEEHLLHLLFYIHLNPLDLIEPGWRRGEVENFQKAWEFLKNYRWSSFLDYVGKKNFPSVSQRQFLLKFLKDEESVKEEVEKWLSKMSLENLQPFLLEPIA